MCTRRLLRNDVADVTIKDAFHSQQIQGLFLGLQLRPFDSRLIEVAAQWYVFALGVAVVVSNPHFSIFALARAPVHVWW